MTKPSSKNAPRTRGAIAVAVVGITLLGAAGCGEEPDDVQTTPSPITGGWTNLQLISPWVNYHTSSYPPAIGIVNGIVTLRGAIKNTASMPTSDVAFLVDTAPFTQFLPNPEAQIYMRTRMRTPSQPGMPAFDVNGLLELDPFDGVPPGSVKAVHVHEDGVGLGQVGNAAKNFTSLEGLAFDKSPGTPLVYDHFVWHSQYSLRQAESGCSLYDCGVYARMTSDGFVRFQGFLYKVDQNNFDGYLFTLPSSPVNYRPGQIVQVPCNLGDPETGTPPNTSFGALIIYPSGDVFVDGNIIAANVGTSFENVWFSKTNAGNVNLALSNGWTTYSPRTVKVGKYGDVVRFQGAIKNGTSGTIAQLPAGYAPARTVRLVAVASGPVPATIVVTTGGAVSVEGPPLSVSAMFLSLDGVSYAR
jgi:hypothetical protein